MDRAKELRRNQTDAERTLWTHLRDRRLEGYKFRRQRPLGRYIVDLICLEEMLVVEVDGGQHSWQQLYDSERNEWLESQRDTECCDFGTTRC
jgi:very-short-patch-repair endonuclease